ncbi:MAG: radical SAM protein [Candidatus Omnitrophota bacterium]
MKVLLIEPPPLGRYGNQRSKGAFGNLKADIRWPPIDLVVIAGHLRKNNIEAAIIDAGGERLSADALLGRVSAVKAGLTLINTSTTTIYQDLEIARLVKQASGRSLLGVIGVHIMALPKETLALCPELDFAVFSEPEIPILNLCKAMDMALVNGICFRKGKDILMNPAQEPVNDLDELGIPAHDLLPLGVYKEPQMKRKPLAVTMVSRGCINRCVFCSAAFYGAYRLRSVEDVMEELRWITRALGVRELKFYDDGITYNRSWAEQLFMAMANEGIDLTWNANIRADSIDYQLALLMKQAGCHTVNIGLESGSQKILNNVRKNVTIETMRRAVLDCKKAGLEVCGYFVFGLPGETRQSIKMSIELAKELDLDLVTFNTATPHPGTDFFTYLEGNGFLRSNDWSQYDTNGLPVFDYPGLSASAMYDQAMAAYRKFYLRPRFFFKRFKRISSLNELKNTAGNFIAFMNNFLFKNARP